MSTNELVTIYQVFEKRTKSIDESTVMAGNDVEKSEVQEETDKLPLLPSVDESKDEKRLRILKQCQVILKWTTKLPTPRARRNHRTAV